MTGQPESLESPWPCSFLDMHDITESCQHGGFYIDVAKVFWAHFTSGKGQPMYPMSSQAGVMKVLYVLTCGGLRLTGGVSSLVNLHFIFETRYLPEPGAYWVGRPAGQQSQRSSCLSLLSDEITGTYCTQIFMWAIGTQSNLGPQDCAASSAIWDSSAAHLLFSQTFKNVYYYFKIVCAYMYVCTYMYKHLWSSPGAGVTRWLVRHPTWVRRNHLRFSAREVYVLKCSATKEQRCFVLFETIAYTYTDTVQIQQC